MLKTISLLFLILTLASCENPTPTDPNGTDDTVTTAGTDGGTITDPVTEDPTPTTTTGGTSGGTTTTGGTSGGTSGGSTTGTTTGGTSTTGGTTGGTVSDVPAQALTWSADIFFANFSGAQQDKVERAVELMRKVIASKAFKDEVINHTYNGKKTYVDNNGLTNTQIYQKILDGAEKVGITSKNNRMDVELELYYAATSTIGYTYPNSIRIWMNTKYFNNYTPVNVTGNLMHEWLHKLGFGHDSSSTPSRPYSVPYAIGYMMERHAKKF